MNGWALLFMVFFWSFILILSTFCLTLILYTGGKNGKSNDGRREVALDSKGD